ncbi:hypothetical protein WS66_12100 [Burkholderia sp. LA-2-3-30-S1-D2]|nr:hypothetical protein WS66_12100 [Burkholderia sp. LA-2-3-30-S1-D2]KVE13718.1 hypothetical protein WS66_14245 [Burkholderia sp. LA-2-3-30-S1-D2]
MGCLDSDKPLIFFDSKDDDRAIVFLDHDRFSTSGDDQPPEIVFRVLGGLRMHSSSCRFVITCQCLVWIFPFR